MIHPAHRLIQLGCRSLGWDPGAIDSWYGPNLEGALQGLEAQGPRKSTVWAISILQKGLDDLGWYIGPASGEWDDETVVAIRGVLTAKGHAFASVDPETHKPPPEDDEDDTPTPEADRIGLPDPKPTRGRIVQSGTTVWGICLHTTATPGDYLHRVTEAEALANITSFHTRPKSQGGRGWSALGYHAMVPWSGAILAGRPYTRMGAGARGYNRGVIHISMFPTVTLKRMHDDPLEAYTAEQIATVRGMIEDIASRTPITRLFGHREVANKLCPGFEVVDSYWTARAVA